MDQNEFLVHITEVYVDQRGYVREKICIMPRRRRYFHRLNSRGRSQWPCILNRGSAAARLLGLRVRIPLGTCLFVSCEWYVLSRRGLRYGLITHTKEYYRVWCV
jgi:hypothetical protein